MKAICSGPGELSLCGKPATKRLLTRAIFACYDEHAEIILRSAKSGLHLPPDINPWVDCGPEVCLYGIRHSHISWSAENGGDDFVGSKEEAEAKAIEWQAEWNTEEERHPAEEVFYEAQPYKGEHEKFVTSPREHLLGEVQLDLDAPVKCVRLLAGLTQGQVIDRIAAQMNYSIVDAAIIVERSEKKGGDVSIEDFMMISDACGYKVKAFLFTKD